MPSLQGLVWSDKLAEMWRFLREVSYGASGAAIIGGPLGRIEVYTVDALALALISQVFAGLRRKMGSDN